MKGNSMGVTERRKLRRREEEKIKGDREKERERETRGKEEARGSIRRASLIS